MLIKSKKIIVQTLFLVSIQHLISSFENDSKNYEIKYVNAVLFCFSFVFFIFSIVFIEIELNEFFCKKELLFWLHTMIILLRKMKKMIEVFPPTNFFIMKSDVKDKLFIFYRYHPFLETRA